MDHPSYRILQKANPTKPSSNKIHEQKALKRIKREKQRFRRDSKFHNAEHCSIRSFCLQARLCLPLLEQVEVRRVLAVVGHQERGGGSFSACRCPRKVGWDSWLGQLQEFDFTSFHPKTYFPKIVPKMASFGLLFYVFPRNFPSFSRQF